MIFNEDGYDISHVHIQKQAFKRALVQLYRLIALDTGHMGSVTFKIYLYLDFIWFL